MGKGHRQDVGQGAEGSGSPAVGERVNILGVGVHAVSLASAQALLVAAATARRRGYVCVTGVHGIIEAQADEALRQIHNASLLTVPDGMPCVWWGRAQGHRGMGRVYGPDLMMGMLAQGSGFTHFLYGGAPGVAEQLKARLEARIPGVRIVGTFTPPFRDLDAAERVALQRQVAACRPDFFWVGLSTPKQERFMTRYLPLLDTTVMVGVGAAFDLLAGLKTDAPVWMKRAGLQWAHRLCQEPRRLWRRYAVIVPRFLWLGMLQRAGLRRSSWTLPPPS